MIDGYRMRLGAIGALVALAGAACSGSGAAPTGTAGTTTGSPRPTATTAAGTTAAATPTTSASASATSAATAASATGSPAASGTAATGPGATGTPGGATPPAGVTGSIFVTGSSTVQPISAAVAERLRAANPELAVTVEGPGTGDGFERFCAGEADATGASRPIEDEEKQACEASGVEYVELRVALDGIAVLTNPENAVECVTFADLYALTGPESEGIDAWSGGREIATALGSTTTLPELPLEITAPGEESGTYDFYVETVIEPFLETRDRDAETDAVMRPDYNSNPNDNAIVTGISGSTGSLGYVGFAYAEANAATVKLLQVDGGDGCVEPSTETIADGSYPISRPLFLYVSTTKAAQNPALQAYVDYFLADGTIATVLQQPGVRYVNLPGDQLQATQQAWSGAR